MAFLLCKRTGTGPNCSDIRLESTEPEKKDCIKKAMLECIQEVWNCRSDLYKNFKDIIATGSSILNPSDTLGDQECYPYTCIDKLMDCYCGSGLSGLTCSICDADSNDVGFGDDEEEPEEEEEEEETPYPGPTTQRVTISSHNDYIPMIFGTVRVSGNIAWCYGPRSVSVEKEVSVGGIVQTSTYTGKSIDIMLGLCEGEVEYATKVWFAGLLAYDATSTTGPALRPDQKDKGVGIILRKGSSAQKVVKRMSDVVGFGRCPAYRDLAYVFVSNYPVSQAGNNIPDIRVELTNVVSGGPATYSTGDVTNANEEVFSVDGNAGRAVISTSTEVKVVSTASLNEEYAIVDVAKPDSVAIDGLNGGFAYITSANDLTYVSPVNYAWRITSAISAVSPDNAALYSFASSSFERVSSYVVTDDEDIYMYRIDHIARSATLVNTFTGASFGLSTPYLFATIGNFSLLGDTSPDIRAYFVNQDASKNVHFIAYQYFKPSSSLYYSEGRTPTHLSYAPRTLGCRTTTATLLSVLYLEDRSQFILFFQDGTSYTATCLEHGSLNDPVWTKTYMSAAPTGKLQSRSGATDYQFIKGGASYSLDLDTGAFESVYSLTSAGAPSLATSGAQFYDSVKSAIIYVDSTGGVSGIYPERVTSGPTTLSATVDTILSRTGLTVEEYDSSALSTTNVDGYMVASQPSADGAMKELQEFFAFRSYESSAKIKSIPMSYSDTITIDDNLTMAPVKQRHVLAFDELHYARVGYFDTSKDFTYYQQQVSLDMIRGDDNGEAFEGFEYGLNVFTSSDVARRSAEISLNRRIQNSQTYALHLPPKYMSAEPVDILSYDGEKMRVGKTALGGTFSTEVEAYSDEEDIYDSVSALSGVVINPVTFAVEDGTSLPNKLVLVQAPVPADSRSTTVWLGEINPVGNAADFSSYTARISGPNETPSRSASPTEEAVIGRLTALPTTLLNSLSTQTAGTLTVEFSKEVDPDKFAAADITDLYASYTRNLLLVGKELIQFLSASIGMDGKTVTFTGLMRGRFGTDQLLETHVLNELVVLYDPNSIKTVTPSSAANTALFVSAYQYSDQVDGYYSPEVAGLYQDISDQEYVWSGVYVKVKKTTSGGSASSRGVTFYDLIRNPHANAFDVNKAQRLGSTARVSVYAYILKAAYDEATFRAQYGALNYHLSTSTAANANTYIRRRIAIGNNTRYTTTTAGTIAGGTLYNETLLFGDSFSYTSDLHVAIVIHPGADQIDTTPRAIIGKPTGLKIEGSRSYTTAKQVIRYN